jgi:CRISPR-associated endonuclease/helicase Cas3
MDFNESFRALTGYLPFHWQEQLYYRFVEGDLPDACDIPTGLGKTNVMAVWLIALASQLDRSDRKMPLRLVYVVDRRVIVDQATSEAEVLIDKLLNPQKFDSQALQSLAAIFNRSSIADSDTPIALSTLRGQKAENRKWCDDPSRPAIIIGTVDMIGSRILFSGYGKVGINHRSLQAGLLGQDSLIVIDEAHLSPCFVETQTGIRRYIEQYRSIRPFHVMSLSATLTQGKRTLALDESQECQNPVANRRLNASKSLEWIRYNLLDDSIEDADSSTFSGSDDSVERVVARAIEYENDTAQTARSIIIFARTVDLVNKITERLRAAILDLEIAKLVDPDLKTRREIESGIDDRILKMTGEMRGFERDQLVNSDKFKCFLPKSDRNHDGPTNYLIATSCAEVGVNIDADHGICDLTTLDSMIQRIGRINRFGNVNSTVSVLINDAARNTTESDQRNRLDHDKTIRQLEIEIATLRAEIDTSSSPKDILKIRKKVVSEKEKDLKGMREGKGLKLEYPKVERLTPEIFQTWKALNSLADANGQINLSPLSLRGLIKKYPDAIPKPPVSPPLEPAKIEDWSMTTLKQSEYPRPLVHYWLRGVIEDNQAETTFVWRKELDNAQLFSEEGPDRLIDIATTVPSQPQERSTLSTVRAEKIIRDLAKKSPEQILVIISPGGDAESLPLERLLDKRRKVELFPKIAFRTIILPSSIGGLDIDGNPEPKGQSSTDVLNTQVWNRYLIRRNENNSYAIESLDIEEEPQQVTELPAAVKYLSQRGILINRKSIQDLFSSDEERCLATIAFIHHPAQDESEINEAENDENSLDRPTRSVTEHDQDVERYAREICNKIGLSDDLTDVIAAAGYRHDLGKAREWWQKAVGNYEGWRSNPIAKSNSRSFDHSLNQGYRHEFGSLLESQNDETLTSLFDRDLTLHLIASHHGYGRPHFPERAFDRDQPLPVNREAALESIHRFDRLQKRYGWWQLAYLEAILKAADAMASRDYTNGKIGGGI